MAVKLQNLGQLSILKEKRSAGSGPFCRNRTERPEIPKISFVREFSVKISD
ncbi:hypothetical protein [Sutterella seckii]|uniref:hypothetical protein n=1 Tax=Sutterella seckii TaxID=1944635 RepID=UPI00186AA24C|nr:hypothetical protein [Sutterella seckii]